MGLSSKQVSADTTLDWSQIGELDIPKPITADVDQAEEAKNQNRQQKRPLLKCPRCDSTNTKFCYYNNYSRLQPRHYCRTCKRHWTAGGTLRNVPVGGGRKNKRAKTGHSNNNTNSSKQKQQQQHQHQQQQVSVPFSAVEIDSTIFPDVFRQVMFQPQPQFPLLPTTTENLFSAVCNSSNPSSSPYAFREQELASSNEESMLGLMDGWLQETTTQPAANYWNCWDGMMEFDVSGINLSAPNESL